MNKLKGRKMIDLVIDTCTLKHANDPKSKYFSHSVDFINRMDANNTHFIADEGFSIDESNNRSYIGLEYIKHLQPGSLGYLLILKLLTTGRFSLVSNKVPQKNKNYIEQIIKNKKDRLFLRVAFNSTTKVLVSHDFTDYQTKKRNTIKKELNVTIVTAEEINPHI